MADDRPKGIQSGIDWMDEWRMELIERLQALSCAVKDECGRNLLDIAVDYLDDYVVEYFGNEEALMAEHGYPDVAAHKLEHARFKVKLKCLQSDIASRNVPLSPKRVKNELIDWIVDHGGEVDKALCEFLEQGRSSLRGLEKNSGVCSRREGFDGLNSSRAAPGQEAIEAKTRCGEA